MRREATEAAHAVVQGTLRAIRRPAASRRFQQAVAACPPGQVRIVAGGGDRVLDGWINTDVYWRNPIYLDLSQPWPVPPGSVDKIYADNVIEHFTLADGRTVLRHMLTALRPGGVARLATPDAERTARAYLENGDLARRHLERHRGKGKVAEYPVDLLRVTFAEAKHYLGYIYDYQALSTELTNAGFTDVAREEAGQSSDPDFDGLEARVSDTERATALVVMARRPQA